VSLPRRCVVVVSRSLTVCFYVVSAGGYGAAPGYGSSSIPDPYSQPQGYGYGGMGGAYGGAGYY
jgi:hypothetical protein